MLAQGRPTAQKEAPRLAAGMAAHKPEAPASRQEINLQAHHQPTQLCFHVSCKRGLGSRHRRSGRTVTDDGDSRPERAEHPRSRTHWLGDSGLLK